MKSVHACKYMLTTSENERKIHYILQKFQLSYFYPRYSQFSRFTDGSKHNCSPRCPPPISLNDGTKIRIIFENRTIMSYFFFIFPQKYCNDGKNASPFLLFSPLDLQKVPFCGFHPQSSKTEYVMLNK